MAEISRVGPHGYIHGWIHVGVPAPGAKVFHPSHGHGRVFAHNTDYMSVHFDNGHNKQFRVGHPVSAPEHHGWSPGPKETHVNIEAAGTGGTSMGAFRRVKPAATLDRTGDTWHVKSATGGGTLGQIRPGDRPGRWAADEEDPITGALTSAYRGSDFMAAVTALLGKPPYGHSWYRVARPPGDVPRPRGSKPPVPAVRAETSPGDVKGTERLHEYWVHGEGAAKIRWGQGGDYDRCVLHLGKYLKDPHGYCADAHHAATGMWPAQHAAAEKKATGRSAVTTMTERADAKPYGDVKYADPKNGKYPLDSEAHIRAAWSYINMPKNASQYPMNGVTLSEVKARIKAAMDKLGADVASSSASRTDPVYFRTYELEDIHIVRAAQGDSTGRLVEAYATAFNAPAEIQDFEGHYIEEIDPAAFNKVLADIGRSRAGFGKVKVMYNHGMTIHGTPSERGSMPIATPVDIRPEARGLLTLARYSDTPFADEVLENIRNGSITAQSFTGRIVRSDPQLRRGDKHRPRSGELPRVRRMELGLREFGPTPFEAYSGAEIVGVRMSTPGTWEPDGNEYEEALPPDEEAAAGEPLTRADEGDEAEHSARYHQHALYRMTSQEAREKAGLVW